MPDSHLLRIFPDLLKLFYMDRTTQTRHSLRGQPLSRVERNGQDRGSLAQVSLCPHHSRACPSTQDIIGTERVLLKSNACADVRFSLKGYSSAGSTVTNSFATNNSGWANK